MSATSSQGQGGATWLKERGFGAAFRVSLGLANAPDVRRYPYWHIDLHSGSGTNENVGCDGSPIVFLNEYERSPRPGPLRAFFCDADAQRLHGLAARVGGAAFCFNCDNGEILPVVSEAIAAAERRPWKSVGSIVIDPNGYLDESTVPYAALREFCVKHPRMDLMLNLNVRVYKMSKGLQRKGQHGWQSKLLPRVDQFGELFCRKHWLISDVRRPGGDSFVMLIGRNMRTGDHRALGFHHLESARGRDNVDEIEFSKGDIAVAARADSQRALFDVSRVSGPPGLSRGASGGHAPRQLALPVSKLRQSGNRGAPQLVLPMGSV